MNRPAYPDGGRGLPRVAYGDPAAGARALADMIPAVIAQAEALGAVEIAAHLAMALKVAERRAADAETTEAGGEHGPESDDR